MKTLPDRAVWTLTAEGAEGIGIGGIALGAAPPGAPGIPGAAAGNAPIVAGGGGGGSTAGGAEDGIAATVAGIGVFGTAAAFVLGAAAGATLGAEVDTAGGGGSGAVARAATLPLATSGRSSPTLCI